MSLAEEHDELTDDQITAYIEDPASILTHEVAISVYECLDNEIASIQTQIDAAMIEANLRPLSEERQAWAKRASFAAAVKRNQRHKVYQRDKELRGVKGKAFTEPKHSKEEKLLKQQRLLIEAETRRDAKKLALQVAKNREMEIAQQRRDLALSRTSTWDEAVERCANIAQHLNGWGEMPNPGLAEHIAKTIREQKRGPRLPPSHRAENNEQERQ